MVVIYSWESGYHHLNGVYHRLGDRYHRLLWVYHRLGSRYHRLCRFITAHDTFITVQQFPTQKKPPN